MRLKTITLIILSVIMINACKSENNDAFVVDFDADPSGDITLILEDMIEDMRVVALETRDDLILPPYISLDITTDYIITMCSDEVNQFDRDGKFIRRLAVKGRGPNEYTNAIGVIDQKRDRFYIVSYMSDDKISRIDLKTGNFLDIVRPGERIWAKFVDNNGDIVGTPDPNSVNRATKERDSLSRIYFVNPETGETRSIPICLRNSEETSSIDAFRYKKDVFCYDRINSDTLYKFDSKNMAPYRVLKISDKAEKFIGEGYVIRPERGISGLLVFNKSLMEVSSRTINDRVFTFPTTVSQEYLVLDKKDEIKSLKGVKIERFNINLSAEEYFESFKTRDILTNPLPFNSDGYLYYCFSAPGMISFLERALEDETTTDKQRKEINALLSKIDEDDNHIIIYGKEK